MRTDPKCPLCGHKQLTVHHILSNCPEALQQGRYTWRHDCALLAIVEGIRPLLGDGTKLYADLPGMRANDSPTSTIPENLLITSARPDIVLVGDCEVTLIELTIPHNSKEGLTNARTRKTEKQAYQQAVSDLEMKGLDSDLFTIEIGTLGHWLPTSQTTLTQAIPSLHRQTARSILDAAAQKVIGASQLIFRARSEVSWVSSRPLF